MPKDYRERRIDNKPPRAPTRQAVQSTAAADPDDGGGGGMGETIIPVGGEAVALLQPGDGVLWFLRQATSAAAPTGRNVVLKTLSDGAVTHSYASLPSGWSGYITSFAGNFAYGPDGITVSLDETVYVIWDQFTGFTAGEYKLVFTEGDGAIDKAIRIRGVDPADAGTFYSGMAQSPTWSVTYSGVAPADVVNNFPRTVSTAGGVHHSIYSIYQMSGYKSAPASLYSAPGLTIAAYTYNNPTDQPIGRQTIVTFYGDTLSTTTSVEIVAPFEAGWGGTY